MTCGNAESRSQAAERFAAAAAEYKAALRRPEALGSLADRGSVRYNFVCACVLAAGAGAAAAPSLLQASALGLDAFRVWVINAPSGNFRTKPELRRWAARWTSAVLGRMMSYAPAFVLASAGTSAGPRL